MLTIAHFSDLHYGTKHLAEADRCFTAAVDDAIARQVHVAVVTGDATDHALELHSPAAIALARQIRRLADHCPVLMLQGTYSHEPPGTLALFAMLGGKHEVHVAQRIEQIVLTDDGHWHRPAEWLADTVLDSDRALFTCIPTVNKARVAAVVGALSASTAVGEELAALLQGFAPINEQARCRGVATIALSHGTVSGCLTEHGVPMAGLDHEFTVGALFAAGAQAFMLGHIHRHQSWEQDGRWIAYPGSIGRFHYGEQGDKGYLLWQVGAATAHCALIPTPARRTVDLVFDGKPDMDVLLAAVQGGAVDGACVRVRWTVGEEERGAVDTARIEAALAGACEIKLEGRIVPVVRTRACGISHAVSLRDKLASWAASVQADAQPLIARLETLEQREPGDIVQDLLTIRSASGDDRPTNPEYPDIDRDTEDERQAVCSSTSSTELTEMLTLF